MAKKHRQHEKVKVPLWEYLVILGGVIAVIGFELLFLWWGGAFDA